MTANQKIHQARLREWAAIFTEQKSSGLTIREWCKENDVSINKFHYWKRALKEELTTQALPDIAPITLSTPVVQSQEFISASYNYSPICPTKKISFTINGLSIEVDPFVSEEFLTTLIKAVRHA